MKFSHQKTKKNQHQNYVAKHDLIVSSKFTVNVKIHLCKSFKINRGILFEVLIGVLYYDCCVSVFRFTNSTGPFLSITITFSPFFIFSSVDCAIQYSP